MDVFTEILGSRDSPAIAEALHRLQHHDRVDEVTLPRADLSRRRLRARSRAGRDIAIALPRETPLHDGAVLELGPDRALVVRVEAEDWLRLEPADAATALALGYHAGNLHWRVRFDGATLRVALEGPVDRYTDRLRAFLENGRVTLAVESGGTEPA
jgi:urease accessory protein